MFFFFIRTEKTQHLQKEYEENEKVIEEKEKQIRALAAKAQCSEEKLRAALADLHRCRLVYEEEIRNLEKTSNKKSDKIMESGITELFFNILQ
jgi:predicted  nucleic acid-binding Zn-ribbon protein